MMLFVSILSLISICSTESFAQQVIDLKHGCAYASPQEPGQIYTNYYSTKIVDILKEISEAISLPPDAFDIKSSSVQSAVATTIEGRRMILYNEDFIRRAKKNPESKWEVYSIIAHEIGHHILDHNFEETDPTQRRAMELAADEFSGRILRALCLTQEDALVALKGLPTLNHPFYPPNSARIAFAADGWTKKNEAIKREGRDPCGQIIELGFGENYRKLNHARNVQAQVKEEIMIIKYDAESKPGRMYCESFLVTSPYSALTPTTIEWKNGRNKYGKNKEIIWHFGYDGYTRDQVMRPQELGLAVFNKTPKPRSFSSYIPGLAGVVTGSGGLIYGFRMKKEADTDITLYRTNNDPERPGFQSFYDELELSPKEFYEQTDRKFVDSQIIRGASYFILGSGLLWITNQYLLHRKGQIGIIHIGEDYVGAGAKFRF